MFNRIVTPLDGSPLSAGILPYVRTLAKGFGARVVLLRTYQNLTYELSHEDTEASEGVMAAFEPIAEHLHNQADHYLQGVAKQLDAEGIHVSTDVRSGPAAEHIASESASVGSLIAMSTHGRTGLGRWIMGSVTDRVLHTATAPLLVVHPEGGTPSADSAAAIEQLIVPLDGSTLGETALPVAQAVAAATGAGIIVAQAVGVPAGNFAEDASTDMSVVGAMEEAAESYLAVQAVALRNAGVESVRTHLARGSAATELEQLARDTPNSMLVACTHGRSGVSRTVLGSVTDRLARHSGHPALIVRAPSA